MLSMCPRMIESFDHCVECGNEFKRMQISDPRKGYDLLQEDADGWEIRCKGCEQTFTVPRQ